VVRGAVIRDMVAAFDRNFDYLVEVKHSRGIFNTNLYWEATRAILDKTGKVPISYSTQPRLVDRVAALEARQPALEFRPATCRFLQNRPRFRGDLHPTGVSPADRGARSEILIANAYFVPTPSIAAPSRTQPGAASR